MGLGGKIVFLALVVMTDSARAACPKGYQLNGNGMCESDEQQFPVPQYMTENVDKCHAAGGSLTKYTTDGVQAYGCSAPIDITPVRNADSSGITGKQMSPEATAALMGGNRAAATAPSLPPSNFTRWEEVPSENGTAYRYFYERDGKTESLVSDAPPSVVKDLGAGAEGASSGAAQAAQGAVRFTDPNVAAPGACGTKAATAETTCNPFGAIAGEDAAFLEMALGQAATTAGAIGGVGKSQHDSCKAAASLSKAMGLINAGKGAACKMAMEQCISTCAAEKNMWNKRIEQANGPVDPQMMENANLSQRAVNKCKTYTAQFQASIMQAMSAASTFAQSSSCAEMTKAGEVAPVAGQFGQVNCSDPNYARTSPACVCPSNPRDPMCLGLASSQGGTGSMASGFGAGSRAGSGADPGAVTGAYGSGDDLASMTNIKDGPAGKSSANGIPQNGGGFGQGGGANGPMGGSDGEGPGQAQGLNTNILHGASGGGGGGGFASGSGAPSSSGGYLQAIKDKFNLRGLLPNKNDYANRSLAGMTVEAKDGITGPMGPTIWEKVSSRYQQKQVELLP